MSDMSGEGFLRRWARLKSDGGEPAPREAPRAPAPPVAAPAASPEYDTAPRAPLPTLEDVARLTPDADFSAFVARDVDKSVRRLALKKLFSDPHFKAMDGLDIYMSDYNQASPMTPAMLASLKHAPGVLERLLGDQEEEAQPQEPEPQLVQTSEQSSEQSSEPMPDRAQAPLSTQQGNA